MVKKVKHAMNTQEIQDVVVEKVPEIKQETAAKPMSDLIWDEIKDKEIGMFGLPDKKISDYCERTPVEPNKCYLTSKISSFLPALEAALGKKYSCEVAYRFIVVSKV